MQTRNYHREITEERDELKKEVARLREILLDVSKIFERRDMPAHAISLRALVYPSNEAKHNEMAPAPRLS